MAWDAAARRSILLEPAVRGALVVGADSKAGRWRGRGRQECPPHTSLPYEPSTRRHSTLAPKNATLVNSMSAPNSIFVRACKSQPVERTPVWFMRQAGRYMPEYRAVRKQHSLLEICKKPALAAEVTITAAEALGVDAAIIFADLLLPLEVMGLPFHFSAGEGPVIEKPVRTKEDVANLRTDRAADLGYVSEAVSLVAKHFANRLPVIGFCGAPFTLASYMIEGGGSRNYVHAKKMMYNSPADWDALMRKLVAVVSEYAAEQVNAGADVIQIFDSWVGCLSVEDYRRYVLPRTTELVKALQRTGVPIIYFGTDSATLLPSMRETGAEVIGLRSEEHTS